MKRAIVAIYLSGFLSGAEMPAPKQEMNLQPYQAAALANALRAPKTQTRDRLLSYLNPRNSKSESRPLLMSTAKSQRPEAECAIPLLEAHANPALDSKMQVPIQRDSSLSDRMPKLKGLPTCRDGK